jgi:hypothetical protein
MTLRTISNSMCTLQWKCILPVEIGDVVDQP